MMIFVIITPWLVPMKNIKSNNRVQKTYAFLHIEIWVIRLFLNLRYYIKTFKSYSVFFRLRNIFFWNPTSFSLFTINIFQRFSWIFVKSYPSGIRTTILRIWNLTLCLLRYRFMSNLSFENIWKSLRMFIVKSGNEVWFQKKSSLIWRIQSGFWKFSYNIVNWETDRLLKFQCGELRIFSALYC